MKRILLLGLLGAFAGVLIVSCGSDGITEGRSTNFSGRVIDSLTRTPVVDASISFTDTTPENLDVAAKSDSTGAFYWVDFGPGTYTLYCLKEGYRTKSITVTSTMEDLDIESILFEMVEMK